MMSKTHCALGVAVASFAMNTADPSVLGACAIATQLPDVDTSKSMVGRVLFPLSHFLERRFPHRTVTHSFLATGLVMLLALPLRFYYSPMVWRAVAIGYFFGWFGDVFTKSGVSAFYPMTSARLVVPGNPRLRLSTGTRGEYFLFLAFAALLALSLHINTQGGAMRLFTSLWGQPSGVAELFHKEGASKQIIARIVGRAGVGTVNGDFVVEDVEGENLLVRDAQGVLYMAGDRQLCPTCEIAIESAKARTGSSITTQLFELRLNEQDITHALKSLRLPAGARVTFTGELTLKDADALKIEQSLQRFNSLQISGEVNKTVKVRAATLSELSRLSGFDASGQLLAKVVSDVR
jgi:inner membrane protein